MKNHCKAKKYLILILITILLVNLLTTCKNKIILTIDASDSYNYEVIGISETSIFFKLNEYIYLLFSFFPYSKYNALETTINILKSSPNEIKIFNIDYHVYNGENKLNILQQETQFFTSKDVNELSVNGLPSAAKSFNQTFFNSIYYQNVAFSCAGLFLGIKTRISCIIA